MKFEEYLEQLKRIARHHPKTLEYDVVYASDEEGQDAFYLHGDSAWSPMTGLALCLSKEFHCTIVLEYAEGGIDFAGIYKVSDGTVITAIEDTVWRYRYFHTSNFIEFLANQIEWYDWDSETGYEYIRERLTAEHIPVTDALDIFLQEEYPFSHNNPVS